MQLPYRPTVYPWRTQYNSSNTPQDHEVNPLPSKTIPDQSMPVIEIMRRYANGQPLGGGLKNPIWYGDDSGIPDNWDTMDISEKMAFKEENLERIAQMRKELQEEEQLKQEAKREEWKKKFIEEKNTHQPAPPSGANVATTNDQ